MDRRAFLQLLTAGAGSAAFPASMEIPAHRRTGTIEDVEHIVFLTQENRSFDHYFGMLRGMRGFDDPRAVRLASGDPVWKQPDGKKGGEGYVLPFHPRRLMQWRRAVTGDLTSAFDSKTPNESVTQLPSTVAHRPPDREGHPDYKPAEQRMPVQEPGSVRRGRCPMSSRWMRG
jgi:phospholipase C